MINGFGKKTFWFEKNIRQPITGDNNWKNN